jgi:hypothetical protein
VNQFGTRGSRIEIELDRDRNGRLENQVEDSPCNSRPGVTADKAHARGLAAAILFAGQIVAGQVRRQKAEAHQVQKSPAIAAANREWPELSIAPATAWEPRVESHLVRDSSAETSFSIMGHEIHSH